MKPPSTPSVMPISARDDGDRDADQHRDAAAVDQAGEIVAAELVGAERVLPACRAIPERHQQALAEILQRVVRHQQRRQRARRGG